MNDNPYLPKYLSAEYRERRLKEAEHERLLRSISPLPVSSPAWGPLVLTLAHGLIAAGRSLENAAKPRTQPACERSSNGNI